MSTIQVRGAAPYAPAKAVTEVIERYRNQGLPQPLTVESLGRVGVTESLAPRVLQTFKVFGLIGDDGKVTPDFESLRSVSTPEFKPRLVELLRSIYREVFEVIEPSGATWDQVRDAFREFTPHGQIDRMVSLFLGLLDYAEYGDALPTARAGTATRSPGRASSRANDIKKVAPAKPGSVSTPVRVDPASGTAGPSKTVPLGEAGTVTLAVQVNPLLLSKDDRAFLFDLIDKIDERLALQPATLSGSPDDNTEGGVTS